MPVLPPAAPLDAFEGVRFTPLAAPSRGSSRTSVWTVEIQPGAPATPHRLTDEEIFVVLSGEAQVALDGERLTAGPGDTIIVPPDTDLALASGASEPVRLLCVLPVGGRARLADGTLLTPPWAQ